MLLTNRELKQIFSAISSERMISVEDIKRILKEYLEDAIYE